MKIERLLSRAQNHINQFEIYTCSVFTYHVKNNYIIINILDILDIFIIRIFV